jgi:glycosyltransferase involved in cell wall biosynthesis
MARRVLVVLAQMPHDPASGAARSTRAIADLLAAGGFDVRCLATTATEAADRDRPAAELLASLGLHPRAARGPGGARLLECSHHGVAYRYLDTPGHDQNSWEPSLGSAFDRLVREEASSFGPDVVFTFGATRPQLARRGMLRDAGAAVVAALFNHGHYDRGAFAHTDAVYACSAYLAGEYRRRIGLRATAIPQPIDPAEVVASDRDPIFVTYVNPSPAKGVMLAATMLERLAVRRPDIPALVVEARGTAGLLASAALAGGFDLRRHESIMVSPPLPTPAHVFAPTRLLVVPSLWPEPAGRVAIEAMLNGVPPIVSDRGGLPETSLDAGVVVPVPASITERTPRPVGSEVAEPWVDHIERLTDDASVYEAASTRARRAAAAVDHERLAPRYAGLFGSVERRASAPDDLFEGAP